MTGDVFFSIYGFSSFQRALLIRHILLLEEYLVIVGLRFNCTVVTSVGVDTVIFIGVQTRRIE